MMITITVNYFYDQPREYAWFERVYCCFPLSFVDKTDIEIGNKIIMPAEALMPLMSTQISMPMQFEIQDNLQEEFPIAGFSSSLARKRVQFTCQIG